MVIGGYGLDGWVVLSVLAAMTLVSVVFLGFLGTYILWGALGYFWYGLPRHFLAYIECLYSMFRPKSLS